jgi:hypothetical protein
VALPHPAPGTTIFLLLMLLLSLQTLLPLHSLPLALPRFLQPLQPHHLALKSLPLPLFLLLLWLLLHNPSLFVLTAAVPGASLLLLLLLPPLRLQQLQRLLLWLTPGRPVELPDSPPLQLAVPVAAAVPPQLQYSPVHHLKLPGVHSRVARPGPLLLLLLLLGAVTRGYRGGALLLVVPGVPVLLPSAFCDDVHCCSIHKIVLPGLWRLDA